MRSLRSEFKREKDNKLFGIWQKIIITPNQKTSLSLSMISLMRCAPDVFPILKLKMSTRLIISANFDFLDFRQFYKLFVIFFYFDFQNFLLKFKINFCGIPDHFMNAFSRPPLLQKNAFYF